MEIEIKMAGSGAIESATVEGNIGDFHDVLKKTKADPFLEIVNLRSGPVLINKSNILTIKKVR